MEPTLSNYLNLSAKTSTFVSIDVVGSTQLKAGENEQDIIYTFLSYHRLVNQLAYEHHGEVIHITGDGMMCRFEKGEDGARCSIDLLDKLNSFNKKQNHLTRPLALRIGVHTGAVMQGDGLEGGQLISQTLDLTAKLQQSAPTNGIRLSEATISQIKHLKIAIAKVGWDARLQINMFEYSGANGRETAARVLPASIRVLILEQELDDVMKLKKLLWTRQHDALAVYTPFQAALSLPVWKPHLVAVSTDLPWDTGWNFLQEMRTDAAYSGVPILVMSNQSSGQLLEKSLTRGGNGFLRKPLDEQQTLKRVEMALREFYL
jgi:class 3 adenylate cyclase/CheY-like chemotaxis protein